MLLRITQEICKEDADRIRNAKKEIDHLSKMLSFNFLIKDLNKAFTENVGAKASLAKLKGYSVFSEKNVGFDAIPKYYIDRDFERVNFSFCRETRKALEEKDSYFSLDVIDSPLSLESIMTISERAERIFKFDFFPTKNGIEEQIRVFMFVNYFQNRERLYKKIHAILEENKEKIGELTNEFFAEDIVSLFSAKKWAKIKDFDLSANFSKERLHTRDFPPKKADETFISSFSFREGTIHIIELALNEENVLLIDFSLSDPDYSKLKIEDAFSKIPSELFTKDTRPDKFLTKNLNSWLKNYVAIANFEAELYKKIKLKILLGEM